MQQEKDAWKNKFQTLEISYRANLKEKDDLIEILERSSQGISVDNYFQIRFLYPARAYLLTTNSRFDTCIQPGHICEQPIVDSIPVSSQGMSAWRDWRSTPVTSQENICLSQNTQVLAKESLMRSTLPNGIYKPILDKVLSRLQMASISPSPYPPSLQMASISPFPTSHCWYSNMRVQISGHSSVQSPFTLESRKANLPI